MASETGGTVTSGERGVVFDGFNLGCGTEQIKNIAGALTNPRDRRLLRVNTEAMITVLIPASDGEQCLAQTLVSLVEAAADGFVREVVVLDGDESGAIARLADEAGCTLVSERGALAARYRAGIDRGRRGSWLLFLRRGVALAPGWQSQAAAFMERVDRSGGEAAAIFRFGLDELGVAARAAEWRVRVASRLFALPAPEQALLIPRRFYERLGGHRDLPRCEEIDLFRRIGRGRLHVLNAEARAPSRRFLEGRGSAITGALLALHLPTTLVSRLGA